MTSNAEDDTSLTTDPLDSIPPLVTAVLTSEPDKVAVLKLVADSIAQQRQQASRAVIFHPFTIALYILALGIVSQIFYKTPSDIGVTVTTCAGVTMLFLVGIRGLTSSYLNLAEEITWKYLDNEDGEEDIVIGSRYGEEIIGALILRLERAGNGNGKKKAKSSKAGGKGVVRAWTTRLRYRGKGIGTGLLEEAARVTRDRLGNSADIGFAAEHANSKMILPGVFNGGFRKREARAAKTLETVVENAEISTKKKR